MRQNPAGYIFTKGEMVQSFEEAVYGARIDEITKPVQSDYGYHIIKRLALPALSEEFRRKIAVSLAEQVLEESAAPQMVLPAETITEMLSETK